jgi:hypothetical protein
MKRRRLSMTFWVIVCYDADTSESKSTREAEMKETMLQNQTELREAAVALPQFLLPDATSTMKDALIRALEYAAQKQGLSDPQASLEWVRQGDRRALEYCHYRLAQQVAEALGALDENVQSVSVYEFEATPEDGAFGERPEVLPIHLLVRVDRKTSALHSLVAALDRALVKDYAELVGPRRLGHVLDVQVIDDGDVDSRRGVAALLSSLYNRPLQIWER